MPETGFLPHVVEPMTATLYQRLAHGLSDSPLSPSPSEAHGILCGLICAGHPQAEPVWLADVGPEAPQGDLLAQASTRECRADLDSLAKRPVRRSRVQASASPPAPAGRSAAARACLGGL